MDELAEGFLLISQLIWFEVYGWYEHFRGKLEISEDAICPYGENFFPNALLQMLSEFSIISVHGHTLL